jgi:hypothetical protein
LDAAQRDLLVMIAHEFKLSELDRFGNRLFFNINTWGCLPSATASVIVQKDVGTTTTRATSHMRRVAPLWESAGDLLMISAEEGGAGLDVLGRFQRFSPIGPALSTAR